MAAAKSPVGLRTPILSRPAKINLNPQLAPLLEIGHICLVEKVTIKIKLTNLFDLVVQHRKLSSAKPREVEVEELVDTGATRLYLKPSVIRALGLEKVDSMISQTGNGAAKRWVYEPVRLECQDRCGNFDVAGVGEIVPTSSDRSLWNISISWWTPRTASSSRTPSTAASK